MRSIVSALSMCAVFVLAEANLQGANVHNVEDLLTDDGQGVSCPKQGLIADLTQAADTCGPYTIYEHFVQEINVPGLGSDFNFVNLWKTASKMPTLQVNISIQSCVVGSLDGTWQISFDDTVVVSGTYNSLNPGASLTICPWTGQPCTGTCSDCGMPTTPINGFHTIKIAVFQGDLLGCAIPTVTTSAWCYASAGGRQPIDGDLCTNGQLWAYYPANFGNALMFVTGGCAHNDQFCPAGYQVCCPDGSLPRVQTGCGTNCVNCNNSC